MPSGPSQDKPGQGKPPTNITLTPAAVRLRLPDRLDGAGFFEAVKGRIQRTFLEPQQPAAGRLQAAQDLQAMRLPPLQRGQDHGFEVATQLVAVDRFHAIILDRLGIKSKGALLASGLRCPTV